MTKHQKKRSQRGLWEQEGWKHYQAPTSRGQEQRATGAWKREVNNVTKLELGNERNDFGLSAFPRWSVGTSIGVGENDFG